MSFDHGRKGGVAVAAGEIAISIKGDLERSEIHVATWGLVGDTPYVVVGIDHCLEDAVA